MNENLVNGKTKFPVHLYKTVLFIILVKSKKNQTLISEDLL